MRNEEFISPVFTLMFLFLSPLRGSNIIVIFIPWANTHG
jgi:hypothetical protein